MPKKKEGMFKGVLSGAGAARDKRIENALNKGKEGGGSSRDKKRKK